ncbi:MAG: DciA family protein [Halothiobacillaceae bacterium]
MDQRERQPERPTSLLPTQLLAKARLLAGLDALLQEALPESLRGACHVANLRDGTLVVSAANAALATQLRFVAPRLVPALNGRAPVKIDAIKARVLPGRTARPPRPAPRKLSEQARRGIGETAAGLPPGRLRSALERLSRLREKP